MKIGRPSRTTLAIILIAGYVLFQLLADITAAKIITLFGLFVPGGTLIYALTFTWRDLVHKQLGKKAAVTTIWVAAAANVIMALYFILIVKIAPAPFWPNQEAFAATLGIIPRIVAASIVAELIAELIDTEVFHFAQERKWPQWIRVLISNGISLPIDSVVFVALAFVGTMPLTALWDITWGQVAIKGAITVLSIPLIYMIPSRSVRD